MRMGFLPALTRRDPTECAREGRRIKGSIPWRKLFDKKLHTTYTVFKQKLRIEKAIELLDAGNSITETAAAVGFSDVNYFFRVFKKATGTTPNQYQKLHIHK